MVCAPAVCGCAPVRALCLRVRGNVSMGPAWVGPLYGISGLGDAAASFPAGGGAVREADAASRTDVRSGVIRGRGLPARLSSGRRQGAAGTLQGGREPPRDFRKFIKNVTEFWPNIAGRHLPSPCVALITAGLPRRAGEGKVRRGSPPCGVPVAFLRRPARSCGSRRRSCGVQCLRPAPTAAAPRPRTRMARTARAPRSKRASRAPNWRLCALARPFAPLSWQHGPRRSGPSRRRRFPRARLRLAGSRLVINPVVPVVDCGQRTSRRSM